MSFSEEVCNDEIRLRSSFKWIRGKREKKKCSAALMLHQLFYYGIKRHFDQRQPPPSAQASRALTGGPSHNTQPTKGSARRLASLPGQNAPREGDATFRVATLCKTHVHGVLRAPLPPPNNVCLLACQRAPPQQPENRLLAAAPVRRRRVRKSSRHFRHSSPEVVNTGLNVTFVSLFRYRGRNTGP